ncbi:bifunctional hydroxymethylpyrimidine kinase/phosphomethylpyrimidine kinase [Heliobacterium gestii]|uniref:Hydroxymethylpyrimidine/phosphomethylpyrimidine kinase n=1 Tax=Heliomicrobium gestii TaxID=2699 RepID=A0A845LKG9_HELGE|nr:bifunctional hydroxymethylpyrimidine kinase/phosphomethylpyrimidine kinase [Heliomicrobium gestii]MBM7868158.1 hydroxymethylpyrimidine kinase/phosphomethylpyrimidine kinase [Heliomicrobium gestii]MZP43356.1 bifunctional hydroxymethylpyrimidine kinase/phosphomethylpyrimidine kinase [Heliomicrobium gestii]
MLPKVLTIAGSDPSGGAGIQADLKVLAQFGVYGGAAVTALTRQTSAGVLGLFPLPAQWVLEQIRDVLWDLRPAVVKTGMLQQPAVISGLGRLWGDYVREGAAPALVVDPVLSSGTGVNLLVGGGLEAFRDDLLPITTVLTPNVPEAEALSGMPIRGIEDMAAAAEGLLQYGPTWVLLKGGHLPELADDRIVDLLISREERHWIWGKRTPGADLHGTGCTLASALAAGLAHGFSVPEAATKAVEWLRQRIGAPLFVGQGRGVVCQKNAQRD